MSSRILGSLELVGWVRMMALGVWYCKTGEFQSGHLAEFLCRKKRYREQKIERRLSMGSPFYFLFPIS